LHIAHMLPTAFCARIRYTLNQPNKIESIVKKIFHKKHEKLDFGNVFIFLRIHL